MHDPAVLLLHGMRLRPRAVTAAHFHLAVPRALSEVRRHTDIEVWLDMLADDSGAIHQAFGRHDRIVLVSPPKLARGRLRVQLCNDSARDVRVDVVWYRSSGVLYVAETVPQAPRDC